MSRATPWIAARRSTALAPRSRLFCFPHAGGGSALFAPWLAAFGDDVEVCPVVLSGREARMNEPPARRMEDVIDLLVEGLASRFNRPFAMFGHSVGSVVAFEAARRATALGRPPYLLIVSGRRAPHLRARRPPLHRLDDRALLDAVGRLNGTPAEVLADDALMRLFLPSVRADCELNDTYVPLVGRPLGCDLVAVMGRSDPEVDESELLAWREVTSGRFRHHVLGGDHFYFRARPQPLLALVGGYLAGGGGPSFTPS
jgi:surfactin synthase thioesterase subunit